jgi:DNA ligase D-like protein (predicted polymerase)
MATKETITLDVDGPDGPRAVRVTNPRRILFADLGVTKLDVVRYFLAVGDGILRAVQDRPVALERWPAGVFPGAKLAAWQGAPGDGFFQKRLPRGAPEWVQTLRTGTAAGFATDVICPTELAVVAWAANLGTLTFHPQPLRRPDVEHPDQLRIDLDPQAGRGFRDAARVGVALRELLAGVGLAGFPKTSGGRGLHVHVAIGRRWTFTEVRRALIALARALERCMPEEATVSWWKEERGERVFLDYNQVARDRMVASAYSIRPTPRALVSAPLTWDELPDAEPEDFDVTTMPARFAAVGDLHGAGLAARAHSLEPLLELADRDDREGRGGDLPYPPGYPKMPGEPTRVQPSRARAREG